MISWQKITVLSVATVTFGIWLGLIAKQQLPTVLLLAHITVLGSIAYALQSRVSKLHLPLRLLVGSAMGLLAASLSQALALLIVYGPEHFNERYFVSHFYFYPLASMGWLHGAIVFAALSWRARVRSDGRKSN